MLWRTEPWADLLGNVAVLCHFECFLNVAGSFFLSHWARCRKPLVIIEFLSILYRNIIRLYYSPVISLLVYHDWLGFRYAYFKDRII